MRIQKIFFTYLTFCSILFSSCNKDDTPSLPDQNENPPFTYQDTDLQFWETNGTSTRLYRKNLALFFKESSNTNPTISIDTTQTFQSMDGFGYTLTGGSSLLIYSLVEEQRTALLQELFSTDSTNIGVSYLRISIGASDLSPNVYTYDDMEASQTDISLSQFNLSIEEEQTHLLSVLKEILTINPNIKIMATPWTAPVWMKTNGEFKGGSLKPEYYAIYAQYLVKYIQGMASEGIMIDAITPQNEPLHDGNNPSMKMLATEQAEFIKNHLGPAIADASLNTKIIAYDHNCDKPEYPLAILNDPAANVYVDGSAFHLYGGNISALSQVHNAFPDKNIYFTEQWTSANGDFNGDLNWHVKNLIIGATRNWSKTVLEWNLANNGTYGPHTEGGCTSCLGALTINRNSITRNVSYYIIAHASKFVRPGAKRVESNLEGNLQNVAFQNMDGSKVLIVLNEGGSTQSFNIRFKNKIVSVSLLAGAVGTFVWD